MLKLVNMIIKDINENEDNVVGFCKTLINEDMFETPDTTEHEALQAIETYLNISDYHTLLKIARARSISIENDMLVTMLVHEISSYGNSNDMSIFMLYISEMLSTISQTPDNIQDIAKMIATTARDEELIFKINEIIKQITQL